MNGASYAPNADVNADDRFNIGDVTFLINLLLTGAEPARFNIGNMTFNVGGVTFKMMAVEGGTFAMGATRSQGNSTMAAEKPVHLVTLSDYCLGQTEVTQALWNAVMGSNPSNFTGDLNHPVEMVSWNDCQQFITKLNQMTGMTFRMPTEAEWEYAARGGKKTRGNMYAGGNTLDDVAWYNANAAGTTHPVGTKAPNELGIYDMSGNVYEYCSDFSDGNPYPSADHQYNPTGALTGDGRIIRGGSIDYGSDNCRIARRWGDDANSRWKDQGLRLAL
jgi:formylglycine-generating enzyme required for sulfatase activity